MNAIGAGRVNLENYFDENFNNKAVEDKGFGMEKMTAMCTDIFREEMDKCRASRSARAQEARRLGHHKLSADELEAQQTIDLQGARRAAQLPCIDEFFDRMVHLDAV